MMKRGFQRPEMQTHKVRGHQAAAKSKKTPSHLRQHQTALAAGNRVQMANNDADGDDNGYGPTDADADDSMAASNQQQPFQRSAPVSPVPGPMKKPKKNAARGMFAMSRGIPASKKTSKKSKLSPAQDDDMFFGG